MQGAVLDIWQSNSSGDYDYTGFNLRGKIVTDKDGNYVLRYCLSYKTTRRWKYDSS